MFDDIREGARSGQLSHKQAKDLRRQAGEISNLEIRYETNGLSDSEAAELRNRVDVLQSLVSAERSGVLK